MALLQLPLTAWAAPAEAEVPALALTCPRMPSTQTAARAPARR